MSIITNVSQVKELYAEASGRKWVLPCFCSENLTTTEAVLQAAKEYGQERSMKDVPIMLAITCNYDHRSQVHNYTFTGDWRTGLRLFMKDIEALADETGFYRDLRVLVHLDHIQHDLDLELLEGDLSPYSSIMYDASALPFAENMQKTADFVQRRNKDIYIEGACDEIVDATGTQRNELTTPENAKKYASETGANMIVANLGTEHRATGKELKYHSEVTRSIRDVVGEKLVLHGTSSVTSDQVKNLFADGVCKVNIWTALERDTAPLLAEEMVKNLSRVGGEPLVERLVREGYVTPKAQTGEKIHLAYFTNVYRQKIIYDQMKQMVKDYLDMWYI